MEIQYSDYSDWENETETARNLSTLQKFHYPNIATFRQNVNMNYFNFKKMKPKQKNNFYDKREPNIRGLKANNNGNARNMAKTGFISSTMAMSFSKRTRHDQIRLRPVHSTPVRSAVHTNPSRKLNFSKTLFKPGGIWKRRLCILVYTENILKSGQLIHFYISSAPCGHSFILGNVNPYGRFFFEFYCCLSYSVLGWHWEW